MAFVQNFPSFSILLCMAGGIFTSVMRPKAARYFTIMISAAVTAMSIALFVFMLEHKESYAYMMGQFPAPFGNELHIGRMETLLAAVLSAIMLLTQLSGFFMLDDHVSVQKQNLYFIMMDLALAALLVMLYTNDIFTAYVFIEINTIAACALIMVRQNGHTLVATMRYMIMNLLASAMVLLGIAMLYGITGHLLIPGLYQNVQTLFETGEYAVPLTAVIILLTVGLCTKCALFPFHVWAPGAYSYAPPVSSALLSGLVSKGYIFLLVKIYYRVFGMNVVHHSQVLMLLFIFGILGIIIGSITAIKQHDIRWMIAYSSVSQIGYIALGIGVGTDAAVAASVYHMLSHAAGKTLLFISAAGLTAVSSDSKRFRYLHGSGYRSIPSGIAFTIGAFSMVGIPFTAGFISKLRLSLAGMEAGGFYRPAVVLTLAASTLLSAVYFLHTVISIYRRQSPEAIAITAEEGTKVRTMTRGAGVALILLSLITVALGIFSSPVLRIFQQELHMFY